MSFFNAIKKSLGFGDDMEDGLLDDSADVFSEAIQESAAVEVQEAAPLPAVETDTVMQTAIFNHVVEIFNQALPDFLRNSVDPEAQKKQLYDSLDASVKKYLDDITAQTRHRCEVRWANEQSSMRGEMESLKAKAKEIEQQRLDIKQRQLSSDRQRRALNDRVHDLENQIATFDAEREQLDLENKSLINKLKVAAVYEAEAENLRNDLKEAQAEILAMRNNGGEAPAVSTDDQSRIAELEAEIERLNNELAAATEKDSIASEMLNGLQSKASSARSEIEKKDNEINDLKVRLAEAENLQSDIEKLNQQMNLVEEAIEKRDRKIARLKETCESLRNENAELKDTIAENLRLHADTEAGLRNRILELEADPTTPIVSEDIVNYADEPADNELIADTPKISDGDLAMIEESFDLANWMSTEPAETPSMRTGISEAEFGYQAPVRKTPRPDNDAQLSLF
ncbi:MAG: hypothetical protein K2K00_01530 [Muribaculaceae bacterium]|nr:hypothetical protein [Muribaculaceae bacterium]